MAMTSDAIIERVDALYAATGVGDFDLAETLLTDDFFVTEADGLPMAGVYRGRGALRTLYTKVMAMMAVATLEREATLVGDDSAVVLVTIRFRQAGLEPARLCELFRFRDGQVCEIKPYYFDAAPVHAAVVAQ